MVKPLSFKGDKKPKKRKRAAPGPDEDGPSAGPATTGSSTAAELAAQEEDPENDDSWVSSEAVPDVVGPVMIVLPTETPSALACDANGKVFTVDIENMVDGNPATSEPHDVRQVWVANKVAGTEQFRFKGHHGR
jgi:protein FRG1